MESLKRPGLKAKKVKERKGRKGRGKKGGAGKVVVWERRVASIFHIKILQFLYFISYTAALRNFIITKVLI